MNTELLGVIAMFVITFVLAIPLGRYIARVYTGERTLLDVMSPIERLIYRLCGIDAAKPMSWKHAMIALLSMNAMWLVYALVILMNQGWLPLNPDANPSMRFDLALNTAISFLVNCDLQHYSGESALSYFSQLGALMFLQFVSAATGMASAAFVVLSMRSSKVQEVTNYYRLFILSCTRVLIPLSVGVALLLLLSGVPMTFAGKEVQTTMFGDTMAVSRGPVAAMEAIKQIGTNGGGWFGANSAHPLENPSYFSNMIENICIPLVAIAMIFALGHMLLRKKLAFMILAVMTTGFLILFIPTIVQETSSNPALTSLGLQQRGGNMEGKETRFGGGASAYWAITTTVTSNGSVNSMHDSLMPLSGAFAMLGMMVNALWGGVGVGFLNFYIFIILAVFISGLMVGRTPEFLGKKIEAREVKIAMVIALLHPFLILVSTALVSALVSNGATGAFSSLGTPSQWLTNSGFHGFSQALYEYTSSAANNGSGFEGLNDNNAFWNVSCAVVLLLGRYLPIIGPVAIAGYLAEKKEVPETSGTLQTDTPTFAIMVFAVIVIVAALSFFPALTLGPLAEHFSTH